MGPNQSSNRRTIVGVGAEGKTNFGAHRNARLVLAVVASAVAGAWLGPMARQRTSHALPSRPANAERKSRVAAGRRGLWGQLAYSPIFISLPDDYAPDESVVPPIRWWFEGFSKEHVDRLLGKAGLTPEQLGALGRSKWDISPRGVIVDPPRELVADLSQSSRAHIYEALSLSTFNVAQRNPETFYPEHVDERITSSGLDERTLGQFRKMLYPRGPRMLFSDSQVILPTLKTVEERKRFEQMVHRKVTVLAKLSIDASSDIDAMVAYWGYAGEPKGRRSLLESLARVPGGAELDIAQMLPPFARDRLYTFPNSSEDNPAARHDCVWTSLNFFNEHPDERFTDPQYAHQVLARDYERVDAPKMGDIAVLMAPNGQSVHFAVHLADGLYYTKNGSDRMQPWMLMTLDDLLTFYSIRVSTTLEVLYFRRKA
ncbi:MAG: hypothetical protein JWM82_3306 [Myxococcales bacterium]|nr:hypothetical protein [Myxococcales bacterium]